MVQIYNQRHKDAPYGALYVGRPTQYGNKFTHLKSKTLAEVQVATVAESIESYYKYIRSLYPQFDTQEAHDFFAPLVDKDLICWCAPKGGIPHQQRPFICHAQILAFMAESYKILFSQKSK